MTNLLLLTHLRELLGWATTWLAEARRCAAARREFQALDNAALRDLGMARSEFGSFWAEAHGSAEHTRRRVDTSTHGGLR
jgi:uncharacterized protein YjiS (DUF1127 family)